MEMVKTKWDHFGSNFETLSIWITEKENELNALETSASAMDVQISQIKVTCTQFAHSLFFNTFPTFLSPKAIRSQDLLLCCSSFKLKSSQPRGHD